MTAPPHLSPPLSMIAGDRPTGLPFRGGADRFTDVGLWKSAGLGFLQDLPQVTAVAVGIVVARRRCDPRRALAELIDLATRADRSVLDIAEHLITHYAQPEPPGEGPAEADRPCAPESIT